MIYSSAALASMAGLENSIDRDAGKGYADAHNRHVLESHEP